MSSFARRHAKKILYSGLLLIFAALYLFKPSLTDFLHVVGAKGSVDRQIRDGNFIAARPISVQRGDIVVYQMEDLTWVRRLIGLPGEVISVADGGIFIDGKPIDSTFLEKGAKILPALSSRTIPPNRLIVGTGATEPGAFHLIEIDKPDEMRKGELAFSAGNVGRDTIFALVAGVGYLLFLVFGPLLVEKRLDPEERRYGALKFLWYAAWVLGVFAMLAPNFGLSMPQWNFTLWQSVVVGFVALNVRLTSLLMYAGASLQQSAIASLILGVSGLASAMAWVGYLWQQPKVDEATPAKAAAPRKRSPRRGPPRSRSGNRR